MLVAAICLLWPRFGHCEPQRATIKVGLARRLVGQAVLDALAKAPDIQAEFIPDRGDFTKYDVVCYCGPYWSPGADLNSKARQDFYEYVHRGNGVLLLHDAVGGKGSKAVHGQVFPELGSVRVQVASQSLVVKDPAHPVTKGLPDRFYHAYWEHDILNPGPEAKVILTDADDQPVAVAAELGRGRVLGIGCWFELDAPTCRPEDKPRLEQLLWNSVRWLGTGGPKLPELPETEKAAIKLMLDKREYERKFRLELTDIRYLLELKVDSLLFDVEDVAEASQNPKLSRDCEALRSRVVRLSELLDKTFQAAERNKQKEIQRLKPGQIPRRVANLVMFSGFEPDRQAGWSWYGVQWQGLKASTPEDAHEGRAAAFLSAESPKVSQVLAPRTSAGRRLVLSLQVKSPDAGAYRLSLQYSTGKATATLTPTAQSPAQTYARHVYPLELPEGYKEPLVLSLERVQGTLFFDAVQLEEGMEPTAYKEGQVDEVIRQAMVEVETQLGILSPKVAELAKAAAAVTKPAAAAPLQGILPIASLIEGLKSPEAQIRAECALELGRLRSAEAIPHLVRAIDDPAYPVARNSILALGWMRAKEAVPKLTELLQGQNKWLKRRATQALGIIGDQTAAPKLIPMLDDADYAVRTSAILSLGWLKGPQAFDALAVIAKGEKAVRAEGKMVSEGDLMFTTMEALARTGDEKAIPLIEGMAKGKDKYVQQTAAGFIALLKDQTAGGVVPGIVQPDFLSRKEIFYWLDGRFHNTAGRYLSYGDRPNRAVPWMRSMAFRYARKLGLDSYFEFRHYLPTDPVAAAKVDAEMYGKNGLRYCFTDERLSKWAMDQNVYWYGRCPVFLGLWTEENALSPIPRDPQISFPQYLKAKFTAEQLKALGVENPETVGPSSRKSADRFRNPVLWAEFKEHMDEDTIDCWQENTEWMHALRMNTSHCQYSSTGHYDGSDMSIYGKLGAAIDMNGTEPGYSTASYENAFYVDAALDGEVRPVGMEVYEWRAPSGWHYEIGMSIALAHAQQFHMWDWDRVFKQSPYSFSEAAEWQPNRWPHIVKVFRKSRKISDYLVRTDTPHQGAQVVSGRTSCTIYCDSDWTDRGWNNGMMERYFQHQVGLYQALKQSHVQFDVIWAETLTAEKLARYKVLFLAGAKVMADREVELLREWVKQGGVLISTGTTTLFDQWARKAPDYRLADVFGVKHRDTKINVPLEGLHRYVRREHKFQETIRQMVVTEEHPLLPQLTRGSRIEYDVELGYDAVEPVSAKVAAVWEATQEPAVLVNDFGKGKSVFISAIYPGLCHLERAWGEVPLLRLYYPGVRELLGSAAQGGINAAGERSPVSVSNCPLHVEVNLKTQGFRPSIFNPAKKRLILHLLNYDETQRPVRKVDARVSVPPDADPRVFYPDDGTTVRFKRDGDSVSFRVRDFDIHEVIVLEY
jgi:HEAT repeat protein